MKIRQFPEENYRAIYLNGKTIRQRYDNNKPISELKWPEFYDVKINQKCDGGCSWCYQDSKPDDEHYMNSLEDVKNFFGSMTINQRPFQVAIGGGEPTQHPDFISILKQFKDLGITPNYTTNGMNDTPEIIEATKKYCGGVAVSCHPHLNKYWKSFSDKVYEEKILLNFHIIVSDKKSIDRFIDIYNDYEPKVDYFVMLPYTKYGRASKKTVEYDYLFDVIDKLNTKKIAFGALFYPYLQQQKERFDLSLYEPEIMSKYLDMKDMTVYKSSYSNEIVKVG